MTGISTRNTNPIDNQDEWLTTKEVARLIKRSTSYLDKRRAPHRTDGPPFFRVNRSIYYLKSELIAWMESHRVDGGRTDV